MENRQYYYALTVVAEGANTAAYYALTPTSNLSITQGGATIDPTGIDATMVSIYPQTLQINAAAGSISAGVTIITGDKVVAGNVIVSPPVNVAVVVTLYGNGGQQLGQAIVDPGTDSRAFSWPVTAAEGMSAEDAVTFVQKLISAKGGK
jgi:hypothetical protein